jgi:NADH:ubiquinone oxidoreductase subunit 5 (subunit L)/multisubunit Na+/H+ antiporter MnhA subunit
VVLYAAWYLPKSDRLGRFYSILLLFMAAMLGVVLSENLLLLLIFWEITSLSSFLLVAYHSDKYDRVSAPAWPWRSPAAAVWRCSPASCCSAISPAVLICR